MNENILKKNILITGATGFVGSHLSKKLLNNGWNVHVIIRPQSNLDMLKSIKEKITFHYHDGSTNNMIEIINTIKPEIVFHLASLFLVQHQTKDIDSMIQSNITFGVQLVEGMIAAGALNLINTGTSWQHFQNNQYDPVCLYAATKQAYQDILVYYSQCSSLKVINLKLFDTFGPNDVRPKIFSLIRNAIYENRKLAMSPGEQLIDLVYIDDVVDAFIKASERLINVNTLKWEDYAVSSGKPIALKEIVDIYCSVTGEKPLVNWGERSYRPKEVMIPWNTGLSVPGWTPNIPLREGIKRMESNPAEE